MKKNTAGKKEVKGNVHCVTVMVLLTHQKEDNICCSDCALRYKDKGGRKRQLDVLHEPNLAKVTDFHVTESQGCRSLEPSSVLLYKNQTH